MTDKEKARAYDEAIRKAQDVSHTSEFIKITDLFPQLLESEDEKIRKTLISYFEWVKERDCKSEWNGLKVDDIRAWLEKQKEQKSVQCIEFNNEFEKQVSHLLASVLNGEWEYNEGFVKHAAQSLIGYAKNEIKSGELDKIERLMKALRTTNAQIGELVEENYKLKEQKQEWSEEDEQRIAEIEFAVMQMNTKRVDTKDKCLAWLKSLRPQQKVEWSDEDADMLNCCISSIEEAKENRYAYKETDGDTSYDREIDWLKSLRSQPRAKTNDYITPHKKFFKWIYNRLIDVHGENPNVDYMQSFKKRIDNLQFDEPRWKPSVDQMKALRAVSGLSSSGEYVQNHLWSLYCDLQELM